MNNRYHQITRRRALALVGTATFVPLLPQLSAAEKDQQQSASDSLSNSPTSLEGVAKEADRDWRGARFGFMLWDKREHFEKCSRWGQNNGYSTALPTFSFADRPDGRHHQLLAVDERAGYPLPCPSNKDLRHYGAHVKCSLTMCWLECPSVQKYFHDVSWSARDRGSNIAAAHPTFLFYRGTMDRRIARPEILYLNRRYTKHSVLRTTRIGSPDPDGPPERIIKKVVDYSANLSDEFAYPDLDYTFDSRIGERVFGVSLIRRSVARLLYVPERELNRSIESTEDIAQSTITVKFENDSIFSKRWTVKDARTDRVVINDRNFAPHEKVSGRLTTSSAGYGEIYYRHSDRSTWDHKDFISNGDVVPLY